MLSDEEVYALTGVPRQIVVDLASAVGASRNTVGIVLFVLKHTNPCCGLVGRLDGNIRAASARDLRLGGA